LIHQSLLLLPIALLEWQMANRRWSRLFQKLHTYFLISLLIFQIFAGAYAADSPMPEGMKGWWYFPNLISGDIGEGYNSNSYVSGLIIAAGGKPPILRTGGAWVAPGYDHPLPFPWGKNLARGEKKCGCTK
jgi:hypothetical protein